MSKTIPSSWAPLPAYAMGSGLPARVANHRGLSLNSHYLYANKIREAGFDTTKFNVGSAEFAVDFTVDGGGTDYHPVGKFKFSPSLAGLDKLQVVCCFTGDDTAGDLWFAPNVGDGQALTISATPQTLYITPGADSFTISLRSAGTVSVLTLQSVCIYYSNTTYLGGDKLIGAGDLPTWQALSQTYAAANRPASSYLDERILENQASLLCEASSTIFSRWFQPWSTNSITPTLLAGYRFYAEAYADTARCYVYARAYTVDGTVIVKLNGSTVDTTALIAADGWKLMGPYSLALTPAAINLLEVYAAKDSAGGEGHGVQIAGVYAWEDVPSAADLGLPGAETIPASYRGNDNETIAGFAPVIAELDGSTVTGKDSLIEDAIYLKAYRRRVLVCDWRHRSAETLTVGTTSDWVNGVGYDVTTFDGVIPGNGTNGSRMAVLYQPPRRDFLTFEVWLRVSVYPVVDGTTASYEFKVTGANDYEYRIVTSEEFRDDDGTFMDQTYLENGIWIGPFTVDHNSGANYSPITVDARCLPSGVANENSYAVLHGVSVRDRPMAGVIA